MKTKLLQTKDYLLLIDEEAEIKENYFLLDNEYIYKGGADMANESAKKIVAYYPLTKEAKELDLPLLPEHDIEGFRIIQSKGQYSLENMLDAFEYGLSKPEFQLTRRLKEDFEKFIQPLSTQQFPSEFIPEYQKDWEETTKMFMESMGDNPEDFRYEETLKTITNSGGKEEIQGRYVY